MKKVKRVDKPEDVKMQREIRVRGNYSLVLWGRSFIRHGSGRYLHLIENAALKR